MTVDSTRGADRRSGSKFSQFSKNALLVSALVASTPAAAPAQAFGQGFVPEVEPNDTYATATPLGGTNVVAQGEIVDGNDVDFWSFSASAGSRVYAAVVTASSMQVFNSQLDLCSSDCMSPLPIETDYDDGTLTDLSSSIAGAVLPSTGTFYLRIKYQSSSTTITQIRPYRLYLRVQSGSPEMEIEPNDASPESLPGNGWIAGTMDVGDNADLYSIDLTAGDTLFASLDADPERDGGTTWNPKLGILLPSDSINSLDVDDPSTTSPNSEAIVVTVATTGTYVVRVTDDGSGGATHTYNLSVSVLPATAQGVNCTTYSSSDVPQTILTTAGRTTSTLTIPGHPRIADLDLKLALQHDKPDDLDIHLRSPAGNDNGIVTDIGAGSPFDNWDLTFDDESAAPIGAYNIALLDGLGIEPEAGTAGYRLDWFDGEDAGGEWTLVLDDDTAGNGGTLDAWALRVCEPAAIPACSGGTTRQTVYASDFESDTGGFTTYGVNPVEWQLGFPTKTTIDDCASGNYCWVTDLTGDYNNNSDQTLRSPTINLMNASGPIVVSWAQKYQMENATRDHFQVELAPAEGAGSTQTLWEWRGPDMSTTVGSASTTLQESAGWGVMTAIADSSFAGQNVELRFHLDSDSSVVYDGAAIDDVQVTACIPDGGPIPIFADGFASATTCAWSARTGSGDICP